MPLCFFLPLSHLLPTRQAVGVVVCIIAFGEDGLRHGSLMALLPGKPGENCQPARLEGLLPVRSPLGELGLWCGSRVALFPINSGKP